MCRLILGVTSNDCHCPHCSVSISAWRSRGLRLGDVLRLLSSVLWSSLDHQNGQCVYYSQNSQCVSGWRKESSVDQMQAGVCPQACLSCGDARGVGTVVPRDPAAPPWVSVGWGKGSAPGVIAGHGFLPLFAVVSACCKQDQRIGEASSNQEC